MTYLEDGRCSFSNNLSDKNAIRPFTVRPQKLAVLRYTSWCPGQCYSIYDGRNAKANGVNVYHYLTYLLEKLPDDSMSDNELDQLAPWNEKVKIEIERRAKNSNQS